MPRLFFTLLTLLALLSILGCRASNPHELPADAKLVGNTPPPFSFAPTAAGTVFVRDRAAKRVLLSAPVAANESVTADPSADPSGHLSIGGRVAPDLSLSPTRAYELYFKPTIPREYHPAYNP